jgi:hypothetical protein
MTSVADADGEKNVVSRTVKQFPSVFSTSENANQMKASRWWKYRNEILCADKAHTRASLSAVHSSIRKTVLLNAMTGRGRPQSPWVKSIYPKLLSEFERLSKAGLKFSNAALGELARSLILSDTESDYNGTYKDTDGERIVEKITTTWIQQFQEKTDL